jgi:hypothetical protein
VKKGIIMFSFSGKSHESPKGTDKPSFQQVGGTGVENMKTNLN